MVGRYAGVLKTVARSAPPVQCGRIPAGPFALGGTMSRIASCSCGQLVVTMKGDPTEVTVCHCFECQKSTGSVFGVSTYWPKSACDSIKGEAKLWRRSSDSGRWLDNYFCPVCGSTVYWYAEFAPDEIGIAAGNFADPGFPSPTSAVWDSCRHPWVKLPAEWPQDPRQGGLPE